MNRARLIELAAYHREQASQTSAIAERYRRARMHGEENKTAVRADWHRAIAAELTELADAYQQLSALQIQP